MCEVFIPSKEVRSLLALVIHELKMLRDLPIGQPAVIMASPMAIALARALGITCTPIEPSPMITTVGDGQPHAGTAAADTIAHIEPTPAASPDPQPEPGPGPAES